MSYLIVIVDNAAGLPCPERGAFVKDFDPDAFGGRGKLVCTYNEQEAMAFPNAAAAFYFWKQQSKVHPVRPDGKPNCPLTEFTVEFRMRGSPSLALELGV